MFGCSSSTIQQIRSSSKGKSIFMRMIKQSRGVIFLQKLATYGKDRTWLKKQSKKVAEQYILGTWFKNGSSRYSLKNLGDMKIEYNKLIEE